MFVIGSFPSGRLEEIVSDLIVTEQDRWRHIRVALKTKRQDRNY